jgi:inner membrane protease ATP23
MKWLDLKHHACSEVRASNLSQDCHWLNEFTRFPLTGIFNFVNGHQKCVRRRAELSVAMNPSCKSKEQAKVGVAQPGFRIYNLGFWVLGFGFRISGFGF